MSNDSNRDISIIRHMFKYCLEIEEAMACFGGDEEAFMQNAVFRNAVSMPIQQIGELAKHLSDDFIASYTEIPWRQIKGMRNLFAHHYWGLETKELWKTSFGDTENLLNFCDSLLAEST